MGRRMWFVVGLALGSLPLSLLGIANAHNEAVFYDAWWHPADIPVTWSFDDDFPDASPALRRDRVRDSFDTWQSAPGVLTFDRKADIAGSSDGCQPAGKSVVLWPLMDGEGGVLAETRVCTYVGQPNRLKSFWIRVDRSENWYFQTSTPPPSNKVDLQAVATHEVGHATGWGFANAQDHMGENQGVLIQPEYTNRCENTPIETMCPFIGFGEGFWRSLETHDLHTFDNRY